MTIGVAVGARVDAAATSALREIDGRPVAWFRVAGGKHHGALGSAGAGDRSEPRNHSNGPL